MNWLIQLGMVEVLNSALIFTMVSLKLKFLLQVLQR